MAYSLITFYCTLVRVSIMLIIIIIIIENVLGHSERFISASKESGIKCSTEKHK